MNEPHPGQSDPAPSIPLGAFVLQEPIGRGGMGFVWRGWHPGSGLRGGSTLPVAVKILDTALEDLDQTFRNEVQAVARLDHPGIVWVYDVGRTDAEAADASGGRLAAGRPYLAMEYASRGTLKDWGRLPWEEVREVVLALLDALSHAHARGVVHRDLKPANVLVSGPEDLRQGLKLADFGIAHALERTDGSSANRKKSAIGTVQYMAPEQIRVEHHDTGPWSDLYALGNVAWQLLVGRVPFSGLTGTALVRAQLEEPLPDPIGLRLPDGFVDWLRRCVAKDPGDRFQCCADAATSLLELGPAGGPESRILQVGSRASGTGAEAVDLTTELVALPTVAPPPTSGPPGAGEPSGRPVRDWRRADLPRPPLSLLGAGVALYDVRQPPLIGRVEEVDTLWRALGGVQESGRADLVVVSGPTGIGKSRLSRFLTERAQELGSAVTLSTRFFEEDTEDGAIRRMWARFFRLGEVEAASRGRWLVRVLARYGVRDPENFAVLVGPGPSDRRHERSAAMIRALGRDRPVLLVLDDVDVGLDGVRLAKRLVSEERLPVCVVLCARTEVLAESTEALRLVDELATTFRQVRLGPLAERHAATLIEEALGLSPALAAQVGERTGGNPRFVRHLIGDWVKRGVLVPGPTGFEVRRGEVLDLPASLRDVWDERLARVLAGLSERGARVLERAAVLGLDVVEGEWQRACDDPDGGWAAAGRRRVVPDNERLRQEVLARLHAVRVVEPTATGFRFVHGMIREVLLERAKAADRWQEHHRACATTLRFAEDLESTAERVGRHLLEAGEHEASISPLLQGVVRRWDRAGARSALGLVVTAEEALRTSGLPDRDPRWGEAWQLRARLARELGEVGEAERVAGAVVEREGLSGWSGHGWDARTTLALLRAARGELALADRELQSVQERSEEPGQQGLAAAERALIAARLGDREGARTCTDAAIRLLRRAASSRSLADCWRVVGTTALLQDHPRQAEDALARGLRLYELRGNLVGQADCTAGLGRSALQSGEIATAEARLLQAIHLYEVAGTGEVVRPRTDLARVRLVQDRAVEARDLLRHVRHALARQGRVVSEGLGSLQLAAAAAVADWDEFDHRCRQIELDPTVELGAEGGWAVRRALEAAEVGYPEGAARARRLLELSGAGAPPGG